MVLSCLSKFMLSPKCPHLKAVKRVIHYIKGIDGCGIFMSANSNKGLATYADLYWGRDLDKRKQTLGMIFKMGETPIHWSSKLQPTMAFPTTEAEYDVPSKGGREIPWIRTLLSEL